MNQKLKTCLRIIDHLLMAGKLHHHFESNLPACDPREKRALFRDKHQQCKI